MNYNNYQVYAEQMIQTRMRQVVPPDVSEELEVVERSRAFKLWVPEDKRRLHKSMTWLGNNINIPQCIGMLSKVNATFPGNVRVINLSITRLREILKKEES